MRPSQRRAAISMTRSVTSRKSLLDQTQAAERIVQMRVEAGADNDKIGREGVEARQDARH